MSPPDITLTTRSSFTLNLTPSAKTFSRHERKWRWWNYIALFLVLSAIIQIGVINTTYNILNSQSFPFRIAKRQYPTPIYKHLDANTRSHIEKGTRVYHVTQEFGPATLTELGRTVTALAAAQQASNLTEVAIVMPFYTFMRKRIQDKELEMVMDIRGKRNSQMMTVDFRVWRMMHVFNPPVQAPSKYEWQMINNVNTSVLLTPQIPPKETDQVPVYMIGHANRTPFNQAFKCKTRQEINDENEGLPQEWRDEYFAKAAAAFLAHKATASDEESYFAPIRRVPRVDIVHIHGASSAYVAKFMHDRREQEDIGPRPPAIVYSIYDHEEVNYSHSMRNVKKFLDQNGERDDLKKYTIENRVYMSKLAIDKAEAVVYANQSLAADIIEGRKEFHLKELVMDHLLKKHQDGRFFGINSAVDYYSNDYPFITDKLANRNLVFPKYALKKILGQPSIYANNIHDPYELTVPEDPTYWSLSERPSDFVYIQKDRAKAYLIKRKVFKDDDVSRPVVLFHGPLEAGVGIELLEMAIPYFVEYDMRVVIMGSKEDYPFDNLVALRQEFPDYVTLITTPKDKRKFGVIVRAAADFVFVPNDIGDVAAQGMMFGSAVIGIGEGKLSKALMDRPDTPRHVEVAMMDPDIPSELGAEITSYEYYNSYIFNPSQSDTLRLAIEDAALDYYTFDEKKALREEFILRLIRGAINLAWDRSHYEGPLHEYNQIYDFALEDRPIPEFSRHEVETEETLLSRLKDMEDYE
ncbi:hypothetical protein BDB01DRAFT_747556 [Pilobolus umbonatus]|nr:hypothetical protein BDB01DRAFT_747556 [Pilobolus umbonatus]